MSMNNTTKPGLRVDEMTPGTKVRFTGRFLRNTGQFAGGEGARTWTIVECACALCEVVGYADLYYVAVDQPHIAQIDPTGYEDVPSAERPKWRHINAANLEVAGKLVRPCNLPDAEPPLGRPFDRKRSRSK